jgi:alanyl-tRNA synthetase
MSKTAAEIRQTFLDYFRERGHDVRPSSSLVPADDPTLLFTNAGMVQFKKVFLGEEQVPYRRAATSQKCVRAGGKHNDLEEVGVTTRHHTFFEMLGNFSFGDYFKRDAIEYAWDLMTRVYGIDPNRLVATVHYSDDEAAGLWTDAAGVDPARVYRLGDKDNFWQMAETGPCGPCSELHYDLRPEAVRKAQPIPSTEEFVALGDAGKFVELWNLVFMQYDRDSSGTLTPLPAPSIDTGAGLERLAAVMQGVDSNFHTDLFRPLLARVGDVVGRPYEPTSKEGLGYRVLADHARAVAFLLSDGVFPSSEGRGYVLRRILRRAVRHAWLLGRREPTLVEVVDVVVDTMGSVFPSLVQRREHVLRTTRAEEERFLATIEGGLGRFDELAPQQPAIGSSRSIPGEEAFKLYDTFGFPLDLTELMARERGYTVDAEGFVRALDAQRARSRADRARSKAATGGTTGEWTILSEDDQEFVGYHTREVETEVIAVQRDDAGTVGLQLRSNPFYAEGGGQISDTGEVRGDGWTLSVRDVRKMQGRIAVFGTVEGSFPDALEPLPVFASVRPPVRHDTERNHTATHLLHAALREVLGDHVVQRGSLVAPDRLRFDFAHTAPMTPEEIQRVEAIVNQGIWDDHPVRIHHLAYAEAVSRGAMALFGEKYGDVVRMVEVPGVSMELCGGCHVRHTGEIGLFKLVNEGGVAAGVRRVEAQTGPGAFRHFAQVERAAAEAAALLRTSSENLIPRTQRLLAEKAELEEMLATLRKGGGGGQDVVREAEMSLPGGQTFTYRAVRLKARAADDARVWGDAFLESAKSAVALLAAEMGERTSLFTFVSPDLVGRGLRADAIVREVAAVVGGKGGGRPHMAQAGVGDPAKLEEAISSGEAIVRRIAGGLSA